MLTVGLVQTLLLPRIWRYATACAIVQRVYLYSSFILGLLLSITPDLVIARFDMGCGVDILIEHVNTHARKSRDTLIGCSVLKSLILMEL